VDEAPDLQCIMEQLYANTASNTAQLLYNTELGARVTLALTAMIGDAESGSVDLIDEVNRGIAS
jgi:hypothetical protein